MISKYRSLLILLLVLLALSSFGISLVVYAQGEGGDPDRRFQQVGTDEDPNRVPVVSIPEKYVPERSTRAVSDQHVQMVYFTPQDSNDTNTLVFLYNTSTVTGTVFLQTFTLTGTRVVSTAVAVPPLNLLRITADPVTISPLPPPSWEERVLIDFGDNSAYASLALPEGIKFEGWVAWSGEDTYNPRASVATIPLRLSTDPATLFLPTIERSDP